VHIAAASFDLRLAHVLHSLGNVDEITRSDTPPTVGRHLPALVDQHTTVFVAVDVGVALGEL